MEKNTILLDGKSLTLPQLIAVAEGNRKVQICPNAVPAIEKSRAYVDRLVEEDRVVYGITTGFGEFSKVAISKNESATLQKNLLTSHACGVGRHLPADAVRAAMLLRINALARGFSGIRLSTLQTMVEMLNRGLVPAVPEKGSLGASGDLVPLSHMFLPLIGLGEAYINGELMHGKNAMAAIGIDPITLSSKEGLALINGTQVMTAIGAITVHRAINLLKLADVAAALTMEALNGITAAFTPKLHQLRPHTGQMNAAANMLRLLRDSQRTTAPNEIRVQDAYSLRCIPQIHGASKDAVNYVLDKVLTEINSVTDNPLILADEEVAISCGNFHGQPMALAFDFLGIALAEVANVSERRIERLVNPALSGLPPFLTKKGGLCSGFMIAQYTAAALVSENKVLAHPASVDSIPSSANQEDHVSMGTIAARKAEEILQNAKNVIAIEFICAAQGIDYHCPDKKLGHGTRPAYDKIRQHCPAIDDDRELYPLFESVAAIIDSGGILDAVENAVGVLA